MGMAIMAAPPVLVAGAALAFLLGPVFNVSSVSYRLALTPDELQGRVNSVFRLLSYGSIPVGTAIGGILLNPLGARAELLLIAAGVALCALAVGFTPLRRI